MDEKEGELEIQTSGYKISKPQGCSIQHREYVDNNIINQLLGDRWY